MTHKWNLKLLVTVAILLATSTTAVAYAAQFLGLGATVPQISPVNASGAIDILGIDCGHGSQQAIFNGTANDASNNALDTSCDWIGDLELSGGGVGDGVNDPLVSDATTLVAPNFLGGGFSADVRLANMIAGEQITGFDITVNFNLKYLNVVKIDQGGLRFGQSDVFETLRVLDNNVGQARLAQAILAGFAVPDSGTCGVTPTADCGITLFRIRFDVVGVGTSSLMIASDVITNPGRADCGGGCPHKTQSGSFESVLVYDPTNLLGLDVSWSFAPSPPVPGSPLSLTALALCPGCGGAFSFSWDTNSDGAADGATNPLAITPPPPVVHRVVLTATAGATTAVAVRLLPLVDPVTGLGSTPVGIATPYTAKWLGGKVDPAIPAQAYTGSWRFCPTVVAPQAPVCNNPAPTIAATIGQTDTKTNTWNFGGVYTNTQTVIDKLGVLAPWVGPNQAATFTFLVTVTGGTAAYTVTVSAPKATAGSAATITVTIKYAGDGAVFYDTSGDGLFQVGETILNGLAPNAGTPGLNDPLIKYFDSNSNNIRDGTECIFYDSDNNGIKAATEITIAPASCTISGVVKNNDPKIRFVDISGNGAYNAGTVAAPGTYPASARSSFFDVFFDFGDGQTTTVTGGGSASCAINLGGCVISTTHTYVNKGTFTIAATAKETAAVAVSKIQETGTGPIVVNPAVPLSSDFTISNNNPNTGVSVTFTATPAGGTGPYTFTWDFGDAACAPQPACNTATGSPVSHTYSTTGVKTITLTTKDANNAQVVTTHTVTVKSAGPALCATPCDFTFNPVKPTTGQLVTFTASANGGTAPYTASFNFGDGSPAGTCTIATNPGTCQVTHSYATKGSKTVTLTISDSAAATSAPILHSIMVNSVTPLAATVSCPAKVVVGSSFDCTVSATGGTAPYSGIGTITRTLSTKTNQGGATVSADVTDANGKVATGTTTVVVNSATALAVTALCPAKVVVGTAFNCDVSATGGTAPYTGTGTQSATLSTKTNQAGTAVSFTVTDANGKQASGSATVVVNSAIALTATTGGSCPAKVVAGSAFTCTISATGGTAPYTGTGAISRTLSVKTNQAGTVISFDVTDANGKVATATATVVVNSAIALTATVTCPAKVVVGTAFNCDVAATGGTAPYTGTGTVSRTLSTKTNQAGTTVSASVTDANGKQATGVSNAIVVNAAIALSATVTCPAKVVVGTAFNCTVSAVGGTAPYTGTGTISRTLSTKTNQAGATVSADVTDANGKVATGTTTVVVNSATALAVTAVCPAKVVVGTAFNCTVSAEGGTAPYTGTGTVSRTLSTKTNQAGTIVSFDVTDANGKVATGTATVVVNSATALAVTAVCPAKVVVGTAFNCTVSAVGGTAPYTGTGTISRTLSTKTNQAGTGVSFDVTDANGKVATGTATVVVNSATALAVTVSCPAKVVVGTAFNCTVSAVGGTSPYTGTGTVSRTLATKTNQAGATVSADVTDANGKVATGTTTVVVNSATALAVTAVCPAKVVVGTAFSCTVSAVGGTSPYTGTGSISRTLSTKTNQAGTTVSFDVTDANGKVATGTATVVVNSATALAVTAVCPAKVVVGTAFSCTVSAVGGTSPYTGTGSISRTLSTKTNQAGATVSFDVTDANGKIATGTATVVVNSATALAVTAVCPAKVVVGTAFNCTVSAVGGTSPYTGTGSISRTLSTKTNQAGTAVSFTVTDANGKQASGSATVVVNSATALAVTAVCPAKVVVGTAFNCTVSAVGGTSPYTGTGSISRTLSTKTNQAGTTVSFDVTDANGKVATGTATVVVNSATALAVTAVCPAKVVVGTAFNCTVSAVGGTSPYTGTGSISRTLSTKTNQAGTTVSFDVTDANGKVATGTATVVVNSATALAVTAVCPAKVVVGTAFSCTVSAVGGTSPYTGTGSISRTLSTKTNQAGATVNFDVTDANGKVATGTANVVVNSATALAVTAVCPAKVVVGTAFSCTVSAVGGTSPYTGTGSISRTLSTKTNQAGTVVSFDVTDANGKVATGTANVVVNSATALAVTAVCPAKVVVGTAFNCTVSAVGGTSPYTGTGSISRTLSTKTNQAGTAVSFTVTDANGKQASGSATVVVNSATALAVTAVCPAKVVVGTAFNCTVSAVGGTSPYTGTGTISRTLSTKTNQAGTTVSFDVTDANGKVATGTATVVVNSATALAVTVSCPAKVIVGTAFNCTVSATGGTAPYTGTGTQSATLPAKTNQAGTAVSFSVTDANGKVASGSTTVVVNSATPLAVTASCPAKVVVGVAFNCTVSATGGTSPYTGTGSISRTLATKTNAAGAVVSFDVTDANGKVATGTANVVVNSATALAVTAVCPAKVVVGTAFNCTVSAVGGTAPYTGTGTISRTLAAKTTQAGTTVSFDVTDANGKVATGTANVVVNSATPLAVTVSCPAKVVVGTAFNCTVSATGGTSPYTGTGTISRTLPAKTNQAGATVSADVTDANGKLATGTTTVVVNSATPLTVTVSGCPAKVTQGVPFNCTVSATGGTSPYTGTGTQSTSVPGTGTQTVTFTVTDANGKQASGSTTVTSNPPPTLTAVVSCPAKVIVSQAFNCTVSATGGTPPYGGTGTFSRTLTTKTNQAGTPVCFTVTDSAAGSDTKCANVVVNSATALAVTVNCPAKVVAGTAFNCTVSATGGTSPYTGTGSISRTLPAKTTQAGTTVSFDVTDANGKVATGTANVVVNSAIPLAVTVTCPAKVVVGTAFNCTVDAIGGTAPYTGTGTISRTLPAKTNQAGATVSADVTDANGKLATGTTTVVVNSATPLAVSVNCPAKVVVGAAFNCTVSAIGGTAPYTGTGTISRTLSTKTNQAGTAVSFTVTDANGKQASGSATVVVNSATPLAVTASCPAKVVVGTAFNCDVSATGGTAPYTGTGTQSRTLSTKTFQAGTTVSFTVTDANGKQASGSATVVVNSATPLAVTAVCPAKVVVGTAFSCTVSATGGTAPYTGTGSISITLPAKTNQAGATISFDVTDANGKIATGTTTVVANSATPLAVTVSCPAKVVVGTAFNCTVSATGGTAPYTGTGTIGIGLNIKTNQAGTPVSFNVIDANGKQASGSATVVVNSATPLTVVVTCPAKVVVGTAFNCTVDATGGTGPYTGTGTISRTLATKTNQAGTSVSFSVTDANGKGASGSANVVVNSATPLAVTATCPAKVVVGTAFNCTVSATGGTAPYTGTGTISRTLSTKTNQAGTTVSFTVTDANGKQASGSATVVVNSATPLAVSVTCGTATAGKPVTCNASVSGGTTPYGTISWSAPGGNPPSGSGNSFITTYATKNTVNTVTASVTDANGKVASGSTTVTVAPQPLIADFTFNPANPTTGQTVTFTATVSGGTIPYSFSWNFGDGSPAGTGNPVTHTYNTKGPKTVTLTVTDANAATATATHSVGVSGSPLVVSFSFSPASPTAGKAVTFTATVSGDTPPYSFSWGFGDGTARGTTNPVTHTYATKSNATGYAVEVLVTSTNGVTFATNHLVVVMAQPLVVTVACPQFGVTAGKPFVCSVSATGGTAPYSGAGNFTRTEPVKGMKTETFSVTDANGVTASGSAMVNVSGQPLTASFIVDPTAATAGKPVTFTGTALGGTPPYVFNWNFGDSATGSGPVVTHAYAVKGCYVVTLTVTDSNGVTVQVQQTVCVTGQPLVADFSVSHAKLSTVATFTAVVSGGTPPYLPMDWFFGDGGTGSGNPVSHTYTSTGTFNVTLHVRDANNATVTVSKAVDVTPPLTSIDFTPTKTLIGDTIFTSYITGGTPPVTCTWTFGDGTPAQTGCGHVTHTYTVAGTFTVTLVVHDGNNEQLTVSHQVTVEAGPTLIRGKVHWTHHLTGGVGAVQTFNAKVNNPSSMTVAVTLKVDIFTDGGIFVTTVTCNTSMAPGSTNLAFACTWAATMTGKFMFTATLLYSIDFGSGQNVTGIDGSKSGSFAVVP